MPGGFEPDVTVRTRGLRVGCIGAGMIMAECHLAAYREAGFPVVAIASRTEANARKVADRWAIPKVHATPEALIEDPEVEIVDIAFPPDQQPALIRHALAQPHVRGILAQKPLALTLAEAIALRDAAAAAGKPLSVNQNMRYDQSMRVLKQTPRPRRARRDRLRPDRHARDPALADLPRGLRPADPRQHERAPPRRLALPLRRPRRDHHGHPDRPAHPLRAFRRHHRLDAALSLRRARALLRGRLARAAAGGLRRRPAHRLAGRRHRRRRQGHDRLADRRRLDAHLRLDPRDRWPMGDARRGGPCGSPTPSSA